MPQFWFRRYSCLNFDSGDTRTSISIPAILVPQFRFRTRNHFGLSLLVLKSAPRGFFRPHWHDFRNKLCTSSIEDNALLCAAQLPTNSENGGHIFHDRASESHAYHYDDVFTGCLNWKAVTSKKLDSYPPLARPWDYLCHLQNACKGEGKWKVFPYRIDNPKYTRANLQLKKVCCCVFVGIFSRTYLFISGCNGKLQDV